MKTNCLCDCSIKSSILNTHTILNHTIYSRNSSNNGNSTFCGIELHVDMSTKSGKANRKRYAILFRLTPQLNLSICNFFPLIPSSVRSLVCLSPIFLPSSDYGLHTIFEFHVYKLYK